MFTTAVSENFYKTRENQRSKKLLLSCHLLQKKVTSPWTYTKTNPTEEAPSGVSPRSDTAAAISIIMLATSAKESVTKGHGNGKILSGQDGHYVTGSQSAVIPAGQKPHWKFIKVLVFRMSAWAP